MVKKVRTKSEDGRISETNLKTADEVAEQIDVPALRIGELRMTIVGDSRLVTHKWSEKALKEIADKQAGRAIEKKAPKNPKQECEDATYRMPNDKPAVPSIQFKKSAVNACRYVDGITMVQARGAFHVIGELVPIQGSKGSMRLDPVRIFGGKSDLRYRPEYLPWKVELRIRYNSRAITAEKLVHLFNHAGFGCGVGENRPEKSGGDWGMFHVEEMVA